MCVTRKLQDWGRWVIWHMVSGIYTWLSRARVRRHCNNYLRKVPKEACDRPRRQPCLEHDWLGGKNEIWACNFGHVSLPTCHCLLVVSFVSFSPAFQLMIAWTLKAELEDDFKSRQA